MLLNGCVWKCAPNLLRSESCSLFPTILLLSYHHEWRESGAKWIATRLSWVPIEFILRSGVSGGCFNVEPFKGHTNLMVDCNTPLGWTFYVLVRMGRQLISMGALATQTMNWICPMHQVRSFWPFASVQTYKSSFIKGRSCFGTSLIHIHPPVHHGRLVRWPKFTLHTTLKLTPFFKTGW